MGNLYFQYVVSALAGLYNNEYLNSSNPLHYIRQVDGWTGLPGPARQTRRRVPSEATEQIKNRVAVRLFSLLSK